MKLQLFFFFLVIGLNLFGQSAEKLRKQLQADLLVEEKKQDSVYHLFVEKRKVLDEHRKNLRDRIQYEFDSEALALTWYVLAIDEYRNAFKKMEIDEKGTLPDEIESIDSFPDYRAFVKSYAGPLKEFVLFKFPSPDVSITNEQELTEKNEILKNLLKKYRANGKENIPQFLKLDSLERKLAELDLRLDSLFTVYQSWNKQLRKEERFLFGKYLEARENYRLKGPNGFAEAYREYFWDIHPLPGEDRKVTSEGGFDPVWLMDAGSDDEIYSKVDKSAAYPDGYPGMMSYLRYNLVYPVAEREQGITGRAGVGFVVSETGEISDVRISTRMMTCPECNEEAVRLIESMPRWFPAERDGYYVKSRQYEVIWFIP